MKKKILLLTIVGCILPLNIQAICFKYIKGPKDIQRIWIEVDSTALGSRLPTQERFSNILSQSKAEDPYKTVARSLINTDNVYVTVKWEKGIVNSEWITLDKSRKLENNAAWDITIDDNRKVSYTKNSTATCPKQKLY